MWHFPRFVPIKNVFLNLENKKFEGQSIAVTLQYFIMMLFCHICTFIK